MTLLNWKLQPFVTGKVMAQRFIYEGNRSCPMNLCVDAESVENGKTPGPSGSGTADR